MTHWSFRAGAGLLLASYLVQAAMIYFGPPSVKAAGIAFAAFPGADPFIFGLGAAMAADWGHGDFVVIREFGDDPVTNGKGDVREHLSEFEIQASREIFHEVGGQCDPNSILWWCQDKWMTPESL